MTKILRAAKAHSQQALKEARVLFLVTSTMGILGLALASAFGQ